jgi:DeoR family transcriptional regulator, suf operon transcriptional repressor
MSNAGHDVMMTGRAIGGALGDEAERSTQGRIISILRGREATVDDLATALGVTRGAIRLHLATLERDGLVHVVGTRAGPTKPSRLYAVTPGLEQQLSRAYVPLLTEILHVLSERMSTRKFDEFMRSVGRRLLRGRARPHGSALARAQAASGLLNELGGTSRVIKEDGALWIHAASCPLAVTTAQHPEACSAVESLLSEFTGLGVVSCCARKDRLRCCFQVTARARPR